MDNNFEKFKKLAFLPIDIPYEKLDLNELEVFHDRNFCAVKIRFKDSSQNAILLFRSI